MRAYQRFAGLTVDGVVGRTTWNSLYDKASTLRASGPVVTLKRLPYPGTPLAVGSSGSAVLYYSLLLQRIAYYYSSVEAPPLSDRYTDETAAATTAAVKRFQSYFGLTSDGVVGRNTWLKLYEVYNDIANKLLSSSLRPGEYPGVLRKGSSGTAVRELQFYLYLMSAYESSIPAIGIDGQFGACLLYTSDAADE